MFRPPRTPPLSPAPTLFRFWGIHIVRGSRFVGPRASEGYWVVAPVRTRPPSPPPEGLERRSRERLTLELAGLCLGLLDRRGPPPRPAPAPPPPPPGITPPPGLIPPQLSHPPTPAPPRLQIALGSPGRWTAGPA